MGKTKKGQVVNKRPVLNKVVKEQIMPEVAAVTKFKVKLNGEYLVSWGRKEWSPDIDKGKLFSIESAEFIAKEIDGEIVGV